MLHVISSEQAVEKTYPYHVLHAMHRNYSENLDRYHTGGCSPASVGLKMMNDAEGPMREAEDGIDEYEFARSMLTGEEEISLAGFAIGPEMKWYFSLPVSGKVSQESVFDLLYRFEWSEPSGWAIWGNSRAEPGRALQEHRIFEFHGNSRRTDASLWTLTEQGKCMKVCLNLLNNARNSGCMLDVFGLNEKRMLSAYPYTRKQ